MRTGHSACYPLAVSRSGARSAAPCRRRRERLHMARKEPSLMSSSRLIRLSGLAALVGYALLAVLGPVDFLVLPADEATSVAATSDAWLATSLLGVIGILFTLVG